jgi:DNA-binding GntR family transcriptional regulator
MLHRLPSIVGTGTRDTVRKAIGLLIDEDRVYVVRGLGTFVGPAN